MGAYTVAVERRMAVGGAGAGKEAPSTHSTADSTRTTTLNLRGHREAQATRDPHSPRTIPARRCS